MTLVSSFLWMSLTMAQILQADIVLEEEPKQNIEVDLYQVSEGQTPQKISSKKSNSTGRVSFTLPVAKDEVRYLLAASYDGLNYFSPLFTKDNIPKDPVRLRIYSAVDWTDELQIKEVLYSLEQPAADLQVRQEIIIENPTSSVVLGTNRPILAFTLPKGAHNLHFGYGFSQETTQFEKDQIVYRAQLRPGLTTLSFTYSIEKPGLAHDFEQDFSLPVKGLSLATSQKGLTLGGYPFRETPSKLFQQKWVRVWSTPLDANQLRFEVAGLKLIIPWAKLGPFGGLIVLLLLFALLVKYRPLTSQRKKEGKSATDLLEELKTLQKMKEKDLISTDIYLEERYHLLIRLYPFYTEQESP